MSFLKVFFSEERRGEERWWRGAAGGSVGAARWPFGRGGLPSLLPVGTVVRPTIFRIGFIVHDGFEMKPQPAARRRLMLALAWSPRQKVGLPEVATKFLSEEEAVREALAMPKYGKIWLG